MLSREALGSWLGRCSGLGGEVLGAWWRGARCLVGGAWRLVGSDLHVHVQAGLACTITGSQSFSSSAFLTKCLKSFLILPLNSFQHPQPRGQS